MHPLPERKLPYGEVLVVANPIAGRGRGRAAGAELVLALQACGVSCSLGLTARRGDGARLVRERSPRVELVIAVGGDGTVADVLEGLPTDLPLALCSMGTANVLALDLHLPRSVEGIVDMLARGRTRGLDVAEVNGRLSFLVTGVGIDGAIVQRIEQARSGPITKWNYVRSSLATIWSWHPPALSVAVDGKRIAGSWAWVLVSNIIGYGGFLKLSPERVLDDGRFEVFLFPRGTRAALLEYGLRGALHHLPSGDCRMLEASRVRIEAAEPTPYQVDGDYGGITPVTIDVGGRRHRLCIP